MQDENSELVSSVTDTDDFLGDVLEVFFFVRSSEARVTLAGKVS